MADITLAECGGQVWLVGGVEYMSDLLANALPPNISTEIVQCESAQDVMRMWEQNNPDGDGSSAWQIHPAIVSRIKRASPDFAVYFTQWSALLDADALAVVNAAAAQARALAEAPVRVATYLPADPARNLVSLARLRAQMIEDALIEAGVEAGRFLRETREAGSVPGMGDESQRVDVIVRAD